MTCSPPYPLSEWFIRLLPPDQRPAGPSRELEAGLERAATVGPRAWPGLSVDEEEFLRHLASHVPETRDLLAWLSEVFASDLYLACACAKGDGRALAAFDSHFLAALGPHWSSGHPLSDFAAEVRQGLRERLLLEREGLPPRIAGYSGRGPLAAWVRMAATRLALNLRKSEKKPSSSIDEGRLALRAPDSDPELQYLQSRYADELAEALRVTLAALSPRLANVLRLHYQDGMTIEAMGTMYRVSSRTVQRWLAEARNTVMEETRRLLRERLAIADSQLDSLIGLVRSRLDLSIYRYLRGDE
jgi:RNA polymerase sigma-70 factor (ECF subfamily)